jgi:hypothetical protein
MRSHVRQDYYTFETSVATEAGSAPMIATRFVITQRAAASASDSAVEFCEHKGVGHPDSLCDGVAEAVSSALCRAYLAAYGQIQHYNVDKALLRRPSAFMRDREHRADFFTLFRRNTGLNSMPVI